MALIEQNESFNRTLHDLNEGLSSNIDDLWAYVEMRFDMLRAYIEAINSSLSAEIEEVIDLTEIENAIGALTDLEEIVEDIETIDQNLEVQDENMQTNADNSKTYFIAMIVLLTIFTIVLLISIFLRTTGTKKKSKVYFDDE
jgi:hypothetical protein